MRKFRSRKKQRRKIRKKTGSDEPFRVRLPREKEVLGHVEQLHGGKRMSGTEIF